MLDVPLRFLVPAFIAALFAAGSPAQEKPKRGTSAPTDLPAAKEAYEAEVRKVGEGLLEAIDTRLKEARAGTDRTLIEKLRAERAAFLETGEWPRLVNTSEPRSRWLTSRGTLLDAYKAAADEAFHREDDELDKAILDEREAFARTDDSAPWQPLLDKAIIGSGERAWTRAGKSILSPAAGAAGGATNKLLVESRLCPEYALDVVGQWLEGSAPLVLGLVGSDGQRFDLEVTEPTQGRPKEAEGAKPTFHVLATVQRDRIRIDVDGRRVYLWRDGERAPDTYSPTGGDDPKLFLASKDDRTRFQFSSIELKCLNRTKSAGGSAPRPTPKPSPKPSTPPVPDDRSDDSPAEKGTDERPPQKPAAPAPKVAETPKNATTGVERAKPAITPEWASLIDAKPNPKIVTNAALRAEIEASGYSWRVRDNASGAEMLIVPAGSYTRGASPDDADAEGDEAPAHRVAISEPFYLTRYEVQESEWKHAMEGTEPAKERGLPKGGLSFADCELFLEKLRGKRPPSKDRARLPTEAEWEYACRAGTEGARYGEIHAIAWFDGDSGGIVQPVGGKEPNGFGFCDMLGNVWEWCADTYDRTDYLRVRSAGAIAKDPKGPTAGEGHVIRGGSSFLGATKCRASHREGAPQERSPDYGFRYARTP